MLLLLPSVPMLLAPRITEILCDTRGRSHSRVVADYAIVGGVISVLLSLFAGMLLEKWRRGTVASIARGAGYGFLILIGNGLILFAVFRVVLAKLQ